MRVLVTFAVEAEFAPWRRMRAFIEKREGNGTIYRALFGECEIGVLLTGIGGRSAWLETAKKVWSGDVDICVSSGLAGALRPEYRPGEILAAREVYTAGMGKTISCDAELMRLALENGGRGVGSFYSGDEVILSASRKRELGKSCDAVEMESGEVLREMAALGARGIAIRGISDAAEEDLPLDFNRVTTSTGEVSLSRVLGEVARHPTAVPALIRFGQQSRMAAERLGEFLDRYVQAIAVAEKGLPIKSGGGMSGTRTVVEGVRTLEPIPKTMRAGVYRDKGVVRVEEVPVPEVGDGEVLIKVAACGICGTDIKKVYQRYVEPPQILGHELAGTVVAIGRGVTKWKLGDRVMSFHHIPCGECFYCKNRLFSQCKQYKTTGLTGGFTPNGGGFGEYVKAMPWVAERGIVALPDNVSFEEATFIEPINTIVKAVQKARVAAGETVLIIGCGPIGLQLLMVTKTVGARIYTSDPMETRRSKSMKLGAVDSFDPISGKLVQEVGSRTGGRGADAVLVAVAHPAVVVEALAAARPGGRVLLFAANDPVTKIEFPAAAVGIDEKEILGSYSAAVDIQESAAALVLERKLPVMEIVTHRFPLVRIQEGLDLAARPTEESLKILITHQ